MSGNLTPFQRSVDDHVTGKYDPANPANELDEAMSSLSVRDRLRAIRTEVGYSKFDFEVKALQRERLNDKAKRDKRVHFKWAKYESLYKKCGAQCWWCGEIMPLIKGQIEIDHFDPNADDFNDDPNLGLLHMECNRTKGSMSLPDQAKYHQITITQLIERFKG